MTGRGALLRFTIPGPPIPWARTGGNGKKRYTDKRTRDFKSLTAWCAVKAIGQRRDYPMTGELCLVLRYYLPDMRRRDTDNLLKGVKDALTGVLYVDDSQVAGELQSRYLDRSDPRTEVTLCHFEPVLIAKAEYEIVHGICGP